MKVLFLIGRKRPDICDEFEKLGETVVTFSEKMTLADCREIAPDFIISYNYRYIITEDIIDFYSNRIINLHISLLPWNKGAHPNFWSFWDNTPKGVTIHFVDKGLDTGDILLQKEVFFDETETLESTYDTLQREIQLLLLQNWGNIKSGEIEGRKQIQGGSFHYAREISSVWNKFTSGGWKTPVQEIPSIRRRFDCEKLKKKI